MSEDALYRYLDTNGNGTGTKQATGNYATVSDIFYIQPPAAVDYFITRLVIGVEDTTGMQAEEYGNLGAALTNGITVRLQDSGGTVLDLTDGLPVKTNAGWGQLCYDVDLKSWGAGNELLLVRWTFERAGQPLRLEGEDSGRLEVVLNDDFTGLLAHTFQVQGYQRADI